MFECYPYKRVSGLGEFSEKLWLPERSEEVKKEELVLELRILLPNICKKLTGQNWPHKIKRRDFNSSLET